jgi:hypothetical protein
MIVKVGPAAVEVDSFMLSCRVLGRGVEHRMLAYLGTIARERGLGIVSVPFKPTPKNQPARAFLDSLGAEYKTTKDDVSATYRFPTAFAAALTYKPTTFVTPAREDNETSRGADADKVSVSALARIVNELSGIERVEHAIFSKTASAHDPTSESFIAPRTEREKILASIFADALRLPRVGIHDNYIKLGGDSFLTVSIVSKALAQGIALLPMHVLQHPTIAELATLATETNEVGPGPVKFTFYHATHTLEPKLQMLLKSDPKIEDIYPLTDLQKLVLLIGQKVDSSPGSGNTGMSMILNGQWDIPLLKRAWEAIIARHPTLRTAVQWRGLAEPMQVLYRQATPPWTEIDARAMSSTQREQAVEKHLVDGLHRTIPLEKAPLWRVTLLRLDQERYGLVWVVLHQLFDGWSMCKVIEEVFQAYEALAQGGYVDTTPEAGPREHVTWIRKQDFTEATEFWRSQSGPEEKTFTARVMHKLGMWSPIMHGLSRLAALGSTELVVTRRTSSTSWDALETWARQQQLTLATVMQVIHGIVTTRALNQSNFRILSHASARQVAMPRIDRIIGWVANLVPCQFTVALDEPAVTWMREIQRTRLIPMLQYAPNPMFNTFDPFNQGPLLNVFDFMNFWPDRFDIAGNRLSVDNIEWGVHERSFGPTETVTFIVLRQRPNPRLCLLHNPKRLKVEDAATYLKDTEAVLNAVIADPNQPISALLERVTPLRS